MRCNGQTVVDLRCAYRDELIFRVIATHPNLANLSGDQAHYTEKQESLLSEWNSAKQKLQQHLREHGCHRSAYSGSL